MLDRSRPLGVQDATDLLQSAKEANGGLGRIGADEANGARVVPSGAAAQPVPGDGEGGS